jgi:hypothetical protein
MSVEQTHVLVFVEGVGTCLVPRCAYFLSCDRPAEGVLPNPILGPVPCCSRCAARVGLTLDPFTSEDIS